MKAYVITFLIVGVGLFLLTFVPDQFDTYTYIAAALWIAGVGWKGYPEVKKRFGKK